MVRLRLHLEPSTRGVHSCSSTVISSDLTQHFVETLTPRMHTVHVTENSEEAHKRHGNKAQYRTPAGANVVPEAAYEFVPDLSECCCIVVRRTRQTCAAFGANCTTSAGSSGSAPKALTSNRRTRLLAVFAVGGG